MHRHKRAPSVLVVEEMMAAFDAQNSESDLCEGGNEFGARETRRSAHAATVTRWMPTNSSFCSGTPSSGGLHGHFPV